MLNLLLDVRTHKPAYHHKLTTFILSISNRINSNLNTDDSNRNANFQCGSPSSRIHAARYLLGVAVETAVVDEVEHSGQQRQCTAGDRHPETPVEVDVRRGTPVDVQSQRRLGVVPVPRSTTKHRHTSRLYADCHKHIQLQCNSQLPVKICSQKYTITERF